MTKADRRLFKRREMRSPRGRDRDGAFWSLNKAAEARRQGDRMMVGTYLRWARDYSWYAARLP